MPEGNNPAATGNAEPTSLSLEDAAERFEKATGTGREVEETNPTEAQAQENDTGGSEADATSELASEEESRPEDEDNLDEQAEQQSPAIPKLDLDATVNIEGMGETKLRDLVQGNLLQADYTRKTTELAQERQMLNGRFGQIQQIEQQIANERQTTASILQAIMPQPPQVDEMGDPIGGYQADKAYARQMQNWNSLVGQVQQHQQQAIARTQWQRDQMIAEQGKVELEAFLTDFPEYRTEEKAKKLQAEVLEIGPKAWKLSPEELDVQDHRWGRVLHDALQWRKMKAAKPQADAKASAGVAKPKPTQTTVQQPGRSKAGEAPSANIKALEEKLRKSGSVEDATELQFARSQRKRA